MRSIKGIKDMVANSRGNSMNSIPEENYNFLNPKASNSKEITKNLNLDPKDKLVLEDLMKKINDQKIELDQRALTLQTIQKNFESLSLICKTEKQENLELKKKIETLTKTNQELQQTSKNANLRITDLLERIVRLENDQEKNKLAQSANNLKEEIHNCRQRIFELEKALEKVAKEKIALEQEIAKLNKLSENSDNLQNQVKSSQVKIVELEGTNTRLIEEAKQKILFINTLELRIKELLKQLEDSSSSSGTIQKLNDNISKLQDKLKNAEDSLSKKIEENDQLKIKLKALEEYKSTNTLFLQTALEGEDSWRKENEKLNKMQADLENELAVVKNKLKEKEDHIKFYSKFIDQINTITLQGSKPLIIPDIKFTDLEAKIKNFTAIFDEKEKNLKLSQQRIAFLEDELKKKKIFKNR